MKPAARLRLIAAAAAALLAACATIPVEVKAPPAALLGGSGSVAQLDQGRTLYLGKCTKCHEAYPVAKYTAAEWSEDIMPPMVRKTKLGPADAAAVLAYCLAARQSPHAQVR